jgi:hypothetical protein
MVLDLTIPTTPLWALLGAFIGYHFRGMIEFWRFHKWVEFTKVALGIEDGNGNSDA